MRDADPLRPLDIYDSIHLPGYRDLGFLNTSRGRQGSFVRLSDVSCYVYLDNTILDRGLMYDISMPEPPCSTSGMPVASFKSLSWSISSLAWILA